MRIVSLLPSATDIVTALGAGGELVGVSHSCGDAGSGLPVLTSTRVDRTASSADIDAQVKTSAAPLYNLDIELLERLAPDVVVSQSLCDVCAVSSGDVEVAVQSIASRPQLVNLSPFSLDDIPQGFHDVGRAIGRDREARMLQARWDSALAGLRDRCLGPRALRVAFLDWLDPPFAAGHWIPDLITLLGCVSVLAKAGEPSRQITWADVREARADVVVAACCGFSADRAGQDPVPDDLMVHRLDGYEQFSRPSPRLLESAERLAALLHQVAPAEGRAAG